MVKEIIAVTNDKGGVGKTTTAQNLATGLMLKGFKVLIIDADAQLYDSFCNGWNPLLEKEGKRTLFDAMRESSRLPVYKSQRGLYFTPSSERMTGIEPFLKEMLSPNTVLRELMQSEVDDQTGEGIGIPGDFFDYIIVDCPPSMGSVTINAMSYATGLIIPVQLEAFAVRGLGKVANKFIDVKRSLNPALSIRGFLFVMVDKRLSLTKGYKEGLENSFEEGSTFQTVIRKNVAIPESQDSDSDIFNYDPKSNGAKDYAAFVDEFLRTGNQ